MLGDVSPAAADSGSEGDVGRSPEALCGRKVIDSISQMIAPILYSNCIVVIMRKLRRCLLSTQGEDKAVVAQPT